MFWLAQTTGVGRNLLLALEIRTSTINCEVCKRKSCIPAAVWQWFAENEENLACCSMPKCVFPENGDDPSCALCDLQTSGKPQIAAVLGNGADFHSPQALHHRNPRPAKAFSAPKCVFPEWGCDSAGAFFLCLGKLLPRFGNIFPGGALLLRLWWFYAGILSVYVCSVLEIAVFQLPEQLQ